jgi:hypothetical protein
MTKYLARRLIRLLIRLVQIGYDVNLLEVKLTTMFRVADDNPDVPIAVRIDGGVDAEGESVPASSFTAGDITSDNEKSVSIIDNPDGSGGKVAHFGAPGVANLVCQISGPGGFSFSLGAQVEVTTGQPVSVTGGITLEGLTEDQPASPAATDISSGSGAADSGAAPSDTSGTASPLGSADVSGGDVSGSTSPASSSGPGTTDTGTVDSGGNAVE